MKALHIKIIVAATLLLLSLHGAQGQGQGQGQGNKFGHGKNGEKGNKFGKMKDKKLFGKIRGKKKGKIQGNRFGKMTCTDKLIRLNNTAAIISDIKEEIDFSDMPENEDSTYELMEMMKNIKMMMKLQKNANQMRRILCKPNKCGGEVDCPARQTGPPCDKLQKKLERAKAFLESAGDIPVGDDDEESESEETEGMISERIADIEQKMQGRCDMTD